MSLIQHLKLLMCLAIFAAVSITLADDAPAPAKDANPTKDAAPAKDTSPAKDVATAKPEKQPKNAKKKEKKEEPEGPKKWAEMDYGSAQSATFENAPGSKEFTNKGFAIKIGPDREHPAAIIFDTELLRYSAAWTSKPGEFLNLTGVAFDGAHGPMPSPNGKILWAVKGQHPGVSLSENFEDPRPEPYGPLPRETWGHYKGLYRNGEKVILSYQVGDCDILEAPSAEFLDGHLMIRRSMEISPTDKTISIVLAKNPTPPSTLPTTNPSYRPQLGFAIRGEVEGVESHNDKGLYWIKIAPHKNLKRIAACVVEMADGIDQKITNVPFDLQPLCKGGPANWPQTIETKGVLGTGDGPYVVDTVTVPEENPWKSWMRFGGFDFFKDGRIAVCTWSGDVWIVSGVDDKLEKLTWKRYAAGLFQALGLKIVNDEVYVLGRDQITRLHDLNGDGEADFYECFNNGCEVAPSFHEFAFDLQTDSKGNFYFAKGGAVNPGGRGFQRVTAHNGTILQISPDGKKFEVYATGLRSPNGMSCGPHDELTVSDNQGTWTPECRVSFIHKGSFLGVPDNAHLKPVPTNYGNPICWFPYPDVDNSSGGAVWVTSDKWGPFRDRMLHLSYGTCSLFLMMSENVEGQDQGGVVRFPLDFDTGICRARMNPIDGQVYVAGLKGWQTRAAKDAAIQRVRYTGKPVRMPSELHVKENGVEVGFTVPVDPKTAGDVDSYDVEQWNYIWSEDYGSPEVHVDDPAVKGRQPVEVKKAIVSADGKHVLLVMPDIQPVMQMKIAMKIDAADGSPIEYEIDSTINRVPNYKPKPKPTTLPVTQPTAAAK